MNSQLNIIHVWNVCNVLLNGLTYYIAFIEPLDRFIKCLKKMFLSIPDSVMNSHIYWMHYLLQLQAPNEFPIEYSSCLKCFQRSIELSDLLKCFHWTIGSLYHVFEVDVFEHPRICDEFSHLLNVRFLAAQYTKWIPNWIQFMFEMYSTIYWIVWLIKMLSMNLRFVLWSVWSRCFWASQILWWILTSTECTICCSSKHLMNSQLNTIHVWNVCNGILNGLTYYNAFIQPLHRFIKCLKKMFLSIPDSVMNSHIYWMHDLLQLHASNEFPIEYNSCLKCF